MTGKPKKVLTPIRMEDDLPVAIDWLRANEGGAEERGACQRVADHLANKLRWEVLNKHARRVSREAGVPLNVARIRVRKLMGERTP